MSSSAAETRELERNNLLDMPSAAIPPGANLVLVYRLANYNGIGGLDRAKATVRLTEYLNASPDFFVVGDPATVDLAVTFNVKVERAARARSVDGLFSPLQTLQLEYPVIGSVVRQRFNAELLQVLNTNTLGSNAPQTAADIAGQRATLPEFDGPITRTLREAAQLPASVADTLNIGGTLKKVMWILIFAAIIYGLFTFGPTIKAALAKRGS